MQCAHVPVQRGDVLALLVGLALEVLQHERLGRRRLRRHVAARPLGNVPDARSRVARTAQTS